MKEHLMLTTSQVNLRQIYKESQNSLIRMESNLIKMEEKLTEKVIWLMLMEILLKKGQRKLCLNWINLTTLEKFLPLIEKKNITSILMTWRERLTKMLKGSRSFEKHQMEAIKITTDERWMKKAEELTKKEILLISITERYLIKTSLLMETYLLLWTMKERNIRLMK